MSEHEWDWCGVCQKAFVRCGVCGNNCCSGTTNCDECDSAYEMQNNETPPEFTEDYKRAKKDKYDEFWNLPS